MTKESRVNIHYTKEIVKMSKIFFFDFDGTIVNLDNLNVDAFQSVFKDMFNLEFSRDDFMKYISGKGSQTGLTEYLNVHGIREFDSIEIGKVFDRIKMDLLREKIDEEVYLIPGIEEFVEYYKDRRLIIVTSSKKQYVSTILSHFDILKYFEKVFDRSDVVRGKPDPMPYELAIKYANSNIGDCLVFEDSFYGLQSAKGAGLFTIGVLNKGWNDDFVYNLADSVIESYKDILNQ
jgi:HAD superfamily hydrolase (TIGR01509 family)